MTKIIKINPENFKKEELKDAITALKNNGVIAIPTETVYGLAAYAFSKKAIKKIYEVKQRPKEKPLIVLIGNINQLKQIVKGIPNWVKKSLSKLWPGPVTIILPKKEEVPREVTAGLSKVAVRMPNHPIPLLLANEVGPIVAPSANISGEPPTSKPEKVIEDFYGKIDVIVDAGETPYKKPSTIIDATTRPPKIIREGPIPRKKLEELFSVELQ